MRASFLYLLIRLEEVQPVILEEIRIVFKLTVFEEKSAALKIASKGLVDTPKPGGFCVHSPQT